MKFGVHVSIGGGLPQAVERARDLGCDCFQIFVSNPRGWAGRSLTDAEADAFRAARENAGLGPVVVHLTYLPNLAAKDPGNRRKSRDSFLTQYADAARIGADHFVLHPGSAKGHDQRESAIALVADHLRQALDQTPDGPTLLLENMAGGGALLGITPEELAAIADATDASDAVGVCFDTAHACAAGFPVHEPGGMAAYRKRLRAAWGAHPIRLMHLNDLRAPFAAKRDRHDHIGQGALGSDGIARILHTPGLRRLPCILETPIDDSGNDERNLAAARELAG